MILTYSAATGPGHLTVTELTMNDSVYQSILEINVKPSFWQLQPNWNWIMQQDSDSKYSSNTYNRMTDREKTSFLLVCLGTMTPNVWVGFENEMLLMTFFHP